MNTNESCKVLSVVIPCYNEKENIVTIVDKVSSVKSECFDSLEIIVVDDKSTDGTTEIIKEKIEPIVSKVIYHKENAGKGAGLRSGIKAATGQCVIIQDADLEYDPEEYGIVVKDIFEGKEKVVYGSRFKNQKRKGYMANRAANLFLTKFSNLFTHQHLTDMETCYKAFERSVIQSVEIEENRFGFEPEITSKISKLGIKIKEVPISYYPRSNEEGKKIGLKDGFRALYVIVKYR